MDDPVRKFINFLFDLLSGLYQKAADKICSRDKALMNVDESPVDDNIALVDLDGTVADFDSEMKRRLAPLSGPNEPDYGG